jgi:drug/metabolite transporter (DMT)-like permease
MTRLTRRDLVLLALLTLFWGLNWPVMKISVREFPPLTFRLICMLGGIAVIWAVARIQKVPLAIPQGGVPTVLKLAIPNMFIWHALIIIGVRMLSSGRAAILGYTMPAWAVIAGLVFFGDRISRAALAGIVMAMSGAMLLLSSEFSRISGQPLGTLTVLMAAAAWGFGTVLMKRTQIEMPTISLTLWMLSFATAGIAVLVLIFELPQVRWPNWIEWLGILYNAAIIFGFAHVVWFQLARSLPPVASSLSVMFIPVIGTFSGAWILGEEPHWQDYVAIVLILGAMSTVMFRRPSEGSTS